MRTRFFTNKKLLGVVFVCIAAVLAVMLFFSQSRAMTAHAAFSGNSSGLTRQQLHDQTLATSVNSADTATITILTHGLGGGAGDWSNPMHWDSNNNWAESASFVYDSASIIEKLRGRINGGIRLCVARALTSTSLTLDEYTLNNPSNPSTYTVQYDISQMNFTQHVIVVINFPSTKSRSMEELYDQLHFAAEEWTLMVSQESNTHGRKSNVRIVLININA